MTTRATKARYFKSAAEFSSWLESNHDSASEMLVGFYKKSASRKGARRGGDEGIGSRSRGVGLPSAPAAGLPAAGGALGDERQEAGNSRATLGNADRARARGETDSGSAVANILTTMSA